jgi:hypothetical protein
LEDNEQTNPNDWQDPTVWFKNPPFFFPEIAAVISKSRADWIFPGMAMSIWVSFQP